MLNDTEIAAANIAQKAAILEKLSLAMYDRRAIFVDSLEAIELAASNRKDLTDDQLAARIEFGRKYPAATSAFAVVEYGTGVTTIGGFNLQGSFHERAPGAPRSQWHYLPLADAALNEIRGAIEDAVASKEERHRFNVALRALEKHAQWRRAAGTREKQAEARAAAAIPVGTYAVDEAVEVHAMGHWYAGKVTKIGKTGKVTVRFASGTGTVREKAVDANKVRKPAKRAA